jgi:hypothetical protein
LKAELASRYEIGRDRIAADLVDEARGLAHTFCPPTEAG